LCLELHHPAFTSLDFATLTISSRARSCVYLLTWRIRSLYLFPPPKR
jgi:hypothetical protein